MEPKRNNGKGGARRPEDRKRNAAASRENMYRSLYDSIRDAVVVTDLGRSILDCNPAFHELFGYTLQDIRGRDALLLYQDEHEYRAMGEALRAHHEDGPVVVHTARYRKKNGDLFSGETNVFHLRDEEGKVTGYVSLIRDVTDRELTEEALLRNERLLDGTQAISNMGAWEYDPEKKRIIWTDQVYRIYGVDRTYDVSNIEEDIRFYADEDRRVIEQAFVAAVEKGTAYDLELRFTAADGASKWVRTAGDPIIENGRVVKVIGYIMDITSLKRTETFLAESRERFRRAVENIPDVVVIYDPDLRIQYINPATHRITGHLVSDFIGRRDEEVLSPEIHRSYLPALRKARDTGTVQVVETDLLFPETGTRSVRITCVPLLNDAGEVQEILGITQDYTERARHEKEYKQLLDGMNDTAFVIDFDGKFVEVNRRAVQVLGYTREELLSMGPEDIDPYLSGDAIRDLLHRMEWEEKQVFETRHRTKQGGVIPVEISSSRVSYQGKPAILSVARDITERKRVEQEREKLQDQFVQGQKMEAVGRLAGGVAHDFNNMLTVILNQAEMAMNRLLLFHPIHGQLQEIHQASERSANLTRQLLAFARRQTVEPQVLDLNETVEKMLKMLRRLVGEDIDLAWMPDAALWPVRVDPVQIDQILANLLVNARDAIRGAGKITIETGNATLDDAFCSERTGCAPGDYVLLAVSDTGCGMDKETMENIFEPFFTTKDVSQGTGLGLATVYGVVKQNDGSIDVYSEPGRGTTFKIYLPRHAGSADEEPQRRAVKSTSGRGETVLLVEDETAILEMGRAMLEQLGYRVLCACSPGEAIRLAREHPGDIHLLITDVVMPELDGRQLADRIRSVKPEIKCLFMSGYTADVIAHSGVLDEGVHFIAKPFTMHTLSAKIRELLDRS
jgi:PAS domain S-box-containing protein